MSLLALLVAAQLQTAASDAVPLQELMLRLDQHPSVQAYEAEMRAGAAMADGAMGLPNTRIGVAIENVPVTDPLRFDASAMSSRALMVTQEIPGRGLRGARAGVARARGELAFARREAQRGGLAGELLTALAEYETAAGLEALLNEQLGLLDEREVYLGGRIDAGEALFSELAETDADRALVDQRLADAGRLRAQAASRLTRLVGELEAPPPSVSPVPPPGFEQGEAVFHAVRVAQAMVQAAEAGVAVREREFDPVYGVSVSYMYREGGPGMPGDDMISAQLMVSVPLWSRWSQTPRLEAARSDATAARMRLADAARVSADAFRSAAADYAAAMRAIAALESRHQALEAAAAAAQRRYEAGSIGIRPVLDVRISQTDVRINLLQQRLAADRGAARMRSLIASDS